MDAAGDEFEQCNAMIALPERIWMVHDEMPPERGLVGRQRAVTNYRGRK